MTAGVPHSAGYGRGVGLWLDTYRVLYLLRANTGGSRINKNSASQVTRGVDLFSQLLIHHRLMCSHRAHDQHTTPTTSEFTNTVTSLFRYKSTEIRVRERLGNNEQGHER